MRVQAVFRGSKAAVGYLVYARDGGEAIIVDAPLGSTSALMNAVAQFRVTVKYIVNTHGHWDLIADNVPLVGATGAQLCAHSWDATRLANPSMGVEQIDERVPAIKPSRPDVFLHDGDTVDIDGLHFEIITTPGHTPGSICVYEPKSHALFSGDTIGRLTVGNTDFPGGNPVKLRESLLRLAALPDNTTVFPAHGLATSIGEVRWLLDLAKAG